MELQNFLRDLQEYKTQNEDRNKGIILTLDYVIEDVENLIEEIRLDHVMGDEQ